MKQSRLSLAKPQIQKFFESQKKRVYKFNELFFVLKTHKKIWGLSKSLSISKLILYLLHETKLIIKTIKFPYRPVDLYFWGELDNSLGTIYEIAMALRTKGYLSHNAAIYYHNLTQSKAIDTVYVNEEQPPKSTYQNSLEQNKINTVFIRKARISNNRTNLNSITYCILGSKYTGKLGVIRKKVSKITTPILVTNLERTLIDIAVRPIYSGGTKKVLEAYRIASNKVKMEKLIKILKKINYVYPYHQCIGFYLEYSRKYDSQIIEMFAKLPQKYDFYLDYGIKNPIYIKKWRLYCPANLFD